MPQVIFFGIFFRKVEKIYIEVYSLNEIFNKMEIKIDSENESEPKRNRKPSLLLSLEDKHFDHYFSGEKKHIVIRRPYHNQCNVVLKLSEHILRLIELQD